MKVFCTGLLAGVWGTVISIALTIVVQEAHRHDAAIDDLKAEHDWLAQEVHTVREAAAKQSRETADLAERGLSTATATADAATTTASKALARAERAEERAQQADLGWETLRAQLDGLLAGLRSDVMPMPEPTPTVPTEPPLEKTPWIDVPPVGSAVGPERDKIGSAIEDLLTRPWGKEVRP